MASPFVCVPNDADFCDRGLRAQIDQAIETRGDEAKARWRDVFRQLSEAAPIVPLVNRRSLSLVSKRVGNQQYHPWYGALFDQMWVQ
jgi:peptide/nickel transport system substrate-binding protein